MFGVFWAYAGDLLGGAARRRLRADQQFSALGGFVRRCSWGGARAHAQLHGGLLLLAVLALLAR